MKTPRFTRVALAVVALVAWTGCGDPPPAPPPASLLASLAPARVFRIARIPFRTAQAVFTESEDLFAGLAAPLGYDRVVVETAADYDGVVNMLNSGKVDAAWLGTVSYLKARTDAAHRGNADLPVPVAAPIRDGKADYAGAIIVRKDSGLTTLSQLKGKRVAFVDPESASGFVFPRLLMEAAGVHVPGDLMCEHAGEPDFLHGHDSVVAAVYLKKYDAGAVYDAAVEAVFTREPEKAKSLTVLAATKRIFNEPIVVRGSMPAELKHKLQAALLALKPKPSAEFGRISGFNAASEDSYRDVTAMLAGAP